MGGGPPKGKGKGKGGIKGIKQFLNEAGKIPSPKWANDENTLFVSGLPHDTTTQDLYEIFCTFGPVQARGCRAMVDDFGGCKGFGFVNFATQASAQTAIMTLNGATMPDGTTLTVSVKQPGKNSGGQDGGKG